jgi:hypothetical protein
LLELPAARQRLSQSEARLDVARLVLDRIRQMTNGIGQTTFRLGDYSKAVASVAQLSERGAELVP